QALQDFRNLKPEKAQAKRQALEKENKEARIKVATNLTADQKKRLAEIELQHAVRFGAVGYFTSADIQQQLKLTDEQKEAIKTIMNEAWDKIQEETKDLE